MSDHTTAEITSKERIRALVEGRLPYPEVKRMVKLLVKDEDRFWKYLEVLQDRVPWKERILLRISEHLYVVRKDDGRRIVKCDCGHEFGDYRVNWKLEARVRVRRTLEEIGEVYLPARRLHAEKMIEVREFYCPGCVAQLAVEVVPSGYPLVFEFLPDLDAFYRKWLARPLPDESADWFDDRTWTLTSRWAKEG